MKGKKHRSPEQILNLLSEADTRLNAGQTIAQTCQTLGVAELTFHRWRGMYGGMKGEEVKRLKEQKKKNARLKKIVADLMTLQNVVTFLVIFALIMTVNL